MSENALHDSWGKSLPSPSNIRPKPSEDLAIEFPAGFSRLKTETYALESPP